MPVPRPSGAPSPRRSSAIALLVAVGLLSACQDPSGVGLGLIGEEGSDPNVVVVVPDSLYLSEAEDVTGGFADGNVPAQTRVLVGEVMDPTFGDVSAEAYFDVVPPGTVPSNFFDTELTAASLHLVREYVYGDSTSTLALALHEVAAFWNPIGAAADTAFAVGDLVETYDVEAADSVLTFALPASWVEENDELFRSDSVVTAFDGFRLSLAEGALADVILGLDASASTLELVNAEEDTIDFSLREVFTHIERGPATAPPADRLYLRDGAGQALAFPLPFDALGPTAIARATFRLEVDPGLLDAGMAEPELPAELTLYAVTDDDVRVSLVTAAFNEDDEAYYFSGTALTNIAQDAALGASAFERFEVEPARSPASLGVAPLVVGPEPEEGDPEVRPRLVLTVIAATD